MKIDLKSKIKAYSLVGASLVVASESQAEVVGMNLDPDYFAQYPQDNGSYLNSATLKLR
ncbi:MAG: hypothetical protein HRT71_04840 [Flavobacteriales bacterium]|nr:hypothetical protein [Flavobacteriales bacterium]